MALGEEFSNTLDVAVDGVPVPDDIRPLLVEGYVDDSTHVPDMFVLRYTDVDDLVLSKGKFKIGAKVKLSLVSTNASNPSSVLLEGEVTALEIEVGEKGTYTVVRGLDASHRLFRGTRVEAYLNMSASDIVRQVAGRAGLAIGRLETTTPVPAHTSQNGVSDWDFLRRLAAENNRVLTLTEGKLDFVERTSASAAPGVAPSATTDPLVLEHGVNLVRLRGTVTAAGQVPSVEVRGWDPQAKRVVAATASAATTSALVDAGASPASLAGTFKSAPHVLGVSYLDQQQVASNLAGALADHLAGGFAEIDGVARGNARLRAGTPVRLSRVGGLSGRYVLSSTRHEFTPERGYLTSFTASNTSERSLYGATNAAVRDQPVIAGVVPAVVTNVRDNEKQGRVKVKFPWLSDTFESGWARTLQVGAGPQRGTSVLPEVNDEVLVAFSEGDFNRPYILGGLYNGKDVPQGGWDAQIDSGSGQIVHRGFVSRTGMKVLLLETDQDQSVVLSTVADKQKIVLTQTKDKGIEILSEGAVTIKAAKAVTVQAANGAVNVAATGGAVSVESKGGDVSLKGTNVTIEASVGLELKGTTVKVAGQATAELSAAGVTTVKGSIVKIN